MPTVLYTATEVALSWSWIRANLTLRPTSTNTQYIYDSKKWSTDPLSHSAESEKHVACLYLISLMGDIAAINRMTNGGSAFELNGESSLDPQIAAVVDSPKRFRNGLAEHLAFWLRQVDAAATSSNVLFAHTQPHLQPEDKGHDGLLLTSGPSPHLELQSVKSSIGDPRGLISSNRFRLKKKPTPKKQLDDFYQLQKNNLGSVRMARLVSQLSSAVGMTYNDKVRAAATLASGYNAIVVASSQHDDIDNFEGFEHIAGSPEKRIATFLGVAEWPKFSVKIRKVVQAKLAPIR